MQVATTAHHHPAASSATLSSSCTSVDPISFSHLTNARDTLLAADHSFDQSSDQKTQSTSSRPSPSKRLPKASVFIAKRGQPPVHFPPRAPSLPLGPPNLASSSSPPTPFIKSDPSSRFPIPVPSSPISPASASIRTPNLTVSTVATSISSPLSSPASTRKQSHTHVAPQPVSPALAKKRHCHSDHVNHGPDVSARPPSCLNDLKGNSAFVQLSQSTYTASKDSLPDVCPPPVVYMEDKRRSHRSSNSDKFYSPPQPRLSYYHLEGMERKYAFDDDFSSVGASESTTAPVSAAGPGCISTSQWRKRDANHSKSSRTNDLVNREKKADTSGLFHRRHSRSTKTTTATDSVKSSDGSDSAAASRIPSADHSDVVAVTTSTPGTSTGPNTFTVGSSTRSSFAGVMRRGMSLHVRSRSRPQQESTNGRGRKRSLSFSLASSPMRRRGLGRHGRRRRGCCTHGHDHKHKHSYGHGHGHSYGLSSRRHGHFSNDQASDHHVDCTSDCGCDAQSEGSGAGEGAGAIGGGRGSGRVIPEISVGTVFKPRPEGSILRDWRDGVLKGQQEQTRKPEHVVNDEAHHSRCPFTGSHRRTHSSPGVSRPSFLWQFARWCGRSGVVSVDNEKHCQDRRPSRGQPKPIRDARRHSQHNRSSKKSPAPKQPALRDWRHESKDVNRNHGNGARNTHSFDIAADDLIQLGTYAAHWKSAGKLDVSTAAALRRVL